METYQREKFFSLIGREAFFISDVQIEATAGSFRGFHYNLSGMQGRLVRAVTGVHVSMALDLRYWSETYGLVTHQILSPARAEMFWVPPGFAHALYTPEPGAVSVKSTSLTGHGKEVSLSHEAVEIPVDRRLIKHISAKDVEVPNLHLFRRMYGQDSGSIPSPGRCGDSTRRGDAPVDKGRP